MDKVIYLCDLYDYYKDFFTEKQQLYFEDYYYNDLSLAEIAENHQISRNAVHRQLKIVEEKLKEFEQFLHLYEKKKKIIKLLKEQVSEETLQKLEDLI